MKCTANTKLRFSNRRCERELGHPGLHRFTLTGKDFAAGRHDNYIQEFPDSEAYFPWYRKEEEDEG